MSGRRLLAGIASAVVVVSSLAGVPAFADDGGVSPSDPTPAATVELSGVLRVVPFEAPIQRIALGQSVDNVTVPSGPPTVTLFTDAGAVVDVTGSAVETAISGSRFEGTARVSAAVSKDVQRRVIAGSLVLDEAETGELVADAAADRSAALPVVAATVTAPVAAAVAPKAHLVDVIWYQDAGMTAPTQATVDLVLARLGEYWVSESAGQVASVTRPLAVKFQNVTWDYCDQYTAWDKASAAFGRTQQYYWGASNARHLVVLTPASVCGGAGLGTLGSPNAGGLIHAEVETPTQIDWDQVTFHEFGHNLGLGHSSARFCNDPADPGEVDSPLAAVGPQPGDSNCYDEEYADHYDVMGGGTYLYDGTTGEILVSSMRNIASLSVTQKVDLGALTRGTSLRTLAIADGEVQTVSFSPISATTGVRGLEVVDPRTGERLYVEYRSGTGRDAQSYYTKWAAAADTNEWAPGVRVMRLVADSCGNASCSFGYQGYSTVLQRHSADPDYSEAQWIGVGQQLASYRSSAVALSAITVKVTALTPTAATVEVKFDDGKSKFSTKPAATIATAPGFYGKTLSVNGADIGAWAPAPEKATYQWLRNGVAIAGATAKTYQVNGADVGAQLTAKVTATKTGYTTTSATAAAVTPGGPTTSRISGASRYETAVAVSVAAFSGTVPVVYIATGANYPDALAAAPAAAAKGGPLLLVPSTGTVPAAVLDRLGTLNPARIVVVGGTGAVSAGVLAQLSAKVPTATVDRLFGAGRYDTGRALVRDAFGATGAAEVFIATGRNYPDALSASAVAGGRGEPVILVDGTLPKLDAASLTLISDLGPEQVKIAGGTGAVSAGIQSQLAGLGYSVERLSGASRYETSVAINAASFASATVPMHYWATGTGFADALSGAVLAAVKGAPMYVVQPTCVPAGVATQIGAKTTAGVTLIGGTGALSANVAALTRC